MSRTFDRESLHHALLKMLADKLHVEVPSADTDLVDAGVLDSLAFVTLLMHLEENFGVTVPMEDLDVDRFRSVSHIATYVLDQSSQATRKASAA